MTTADPNKPSPETNDELVVAGADPDEGKEAGELWAEFEAADLKAATGEAEPADKGSDPAGDAAARNEGTKPQDAASAAAADPEKPGATATPAQVAEYERKQAELAKLEQRHRSDEGRIHAHRRRLDELRAAISAAPKEEDPATTKPVREHLASVAEDYPEIVKPVADALDAIESKVKQVTADSKGRATAAQSELTGIIQTETAIVDKEEPGWHELVMKDHPAFVAWVDDQPKRIRQAFNENRDNVVNSESALELVRAYKAHLAPPATTPKPSDPPPNTQSSLTQRRERQLDAASSPTGSERRPVVSGIPEEGDPKQLWNMWDQQDRLKEAQANNRPYR